MLPPLEVAVFSPASALLAQSNGAGRIEFNAPGSYASGGTTPPLDIFSSLSPQMTIPIRVMIRPRGPPTDGSPDFLYSKDEFEHMKREIQGFVESNHLDLSRGDGFVFGILRKASDDTLQVDVERCSELIKMAQPFPCVFHRAFDTIAATAKWSDGLADLGTAGFRGLLTSGGSGNMGANLSRLGEIAATPQQQIQLVAGGGLRAQNFNILVAELLRQSDSRVWLHTAALARGEDGQLTEEVDSGELKALLVKLDGSLATNP
ncbi:hypothetical protein NLU13_1756 [Sarocladium strictum]|uniref:Copper homeostasis protein cutC homolog n=1 Tax=Sarocladium strictum TaxID=5046 RepID=A0AA39GRJ6_SARSR|nr:hypothetical protein NLU13_1756 [Sarocladium strictum]